MKSFIRKILKEQSAKADLLNIIETEGIFDAADLVGGVGNLKKIFKDDPKIIEILGNLNGEVTFFNEGRDEYYEFRLNFDIVDKRINRWNSRSWPEINVKYDESKFTEEENNIFKSFIVDCYAYVNYENIEINPKVSGLFKDKKFFDLVSINGESLNNIEELGYGNEEMDNLYNKFNRTESLNENVEDLDKNVLNFLKRRYKIEDRDIGWEDNPIKFRTIYFDVNGEKYHISSIQNKKTQISEIIEMLVDNEIIQPLSTENKLDPYTQKVVRTIKQFINVVM